MNSKTNINMQQVQSSQISEIGYDADSETLAVRFNGVGDKPGRLYHYSGVSQELFERFESAESKGSFFGAHIKPNPGQYPYQKIDESKLQPGEDEGAKDGGAARGDGVGTAGTYESMPAVPTEAGVRADGSRVDEGDEDGALLGDEGDDGADRSNVE